MKKKILFFCIALIAVIAFSACEEVYNGSYQGPWWTEAGNGPERTGYIETADFDLPKNNWVYKIAGGHSKSTPIVYEGCVYIGATDGNVYCLRDKNGTKKWSYQTEGAITNTPIYKDGMLYVTSNDGFLYILDAKTGKLDSFVSLGGGVKATPLLIENNLIFVAGDEENKVFNVCSLDLETQKFNWTYGLSLNVSTNLTYYEGGVPGGIVYFGCDDLYYYALNAKTGKFIWSFKTANAEYRNIAVYDGNVYFGDGLGVFYCRDGVTGDLVWSHKCKGDTDKPDDEAVGMWICNAPAIADGKVIYGGYDYYVYCRDAKTGELIWKTRAPYWVMGGVTVVGNSVLVGGRGVLNPYDDNANITYLFCFDLDDGERRWESRSRGDVRIAPSVVNGCIYYTDEYGQVIKLW